jgi:pyruvate kinase
MARNRPNMPVLAVTHDETTARAVTIVWGVEPCLALPKSRLNILIASAVEGLVKGGKISESGTYVLTAGHPAGAVGSTNLIRILKKDQIDYYLDAAI